MKTEALYMRDCYLKETEATVLDAGENWFVPDKTVFYPEGGGQPSDTGTARWCGDGTAGGTGAARTTRITKAKKEGGIIRHFVDGEVPAKGATVSLSLDWEPRYAYMRYHTAQHLLSAIVLDKYGAETAGNQIRLESARIDFKPLEIGESELQEVFNEFNMWVEKAAPVTLSIHSREDVIASVDERRRRLFARVPEFVKEIRVVGIEGIDKCPCAGTHVSNARELGKIKLNSTANKGKETLRVDFSLSAPENP